MFNRLLTTHIHGRWSHKSLIVLHLTDFWHSLDLEDVSDVIIFGLIWKIINPLEGNLISCQSEVTKTQTDPS